MFLFGFEPRFIRDPVPGSLEGFKQLDISETQRPNPQAWLQAQRAGLWSLWGGGGGGKKKKKEKRNLRSVCVFSFLILFSPPDQDPLASGPRLSLSLYVHCVCVPFPAGAFSSACILCITGSILYTAWICEGLTKFPVHACIR